MTTPPTRAARRAEWRAAATMVALAGVLITLIFNTINVRSTTLQLKQAADDARASRMDAQVGMLTSLSLFLQARDIELSHTSAARKLCHPQITVAAGARAALTRQLKNYDYLAFLFNQPMWTLKAAKDYWAPSMIHAFDVATQVWDVPGVRRRFPQLERFRDTEATSRDMRPCRGPG
jgi:hypothetical protein